MLKSRSFGKLLTLFLVALAVIPASISPAFAEETEYRVGQGTLVNAGKDSGYSKSDAISKNDVHWGWQLGNFYVNDFTRVTEDADGTLVFLKNSGDEISLWFELEQNINRLNGDDKLSIAEDTNGWDQRFQVAQQNFGRGMLIVEQADYTNNSRTTVYSDFLAAKTSKKSTTKVDVFEEGDYKVALDYEIKNPRVNVFGWKPAYKYTDYQIAFSFSVRNGNSMVFPFDVKTGEELTNAAATANGFRLDLAKSRYLDIDIKREVLNEAENGLFEDTRFNKPAKDGNEYTDEGVYTITVSNRYTGQETSKAIYVGTDAVQKAHVATGRSISKINEMLAEGAVIAADGAIIPVEGEKIEPGFDTNQGLQDSVLDSGVSGATTTDGSDASPVNTNEAQKSSETILIAAGIGSVVLLLIAVTIFLTRRKRSRVSTTTGIEGED